MDACDPLIAVILAHMVVVPILASVRGPRGVGRMADRAAQLLQRLGLLHSWHAFVGSRLDHTLESWLRFHYADGSHDDGLSGLEDIVDPHRVYVQLSMTTDPGLRDAIMGAVIDHATLPADGPTPVALSLVQRTRRVLVTDQGVLFEEREAEVATVELEEA